MGQKINSAAKASKNMFSKLRIENLPFDMIKVRDSFSSHADGIWDVNVAQFDPSLFGMLQVRMCLTLAHSSFHVIFFTGTASADQTAKIWSLESGCVVATYAGHSGSVNCIDIHSTESIACSGAGDNTVHVWRFPVRTAATRRTAAKDDAESGEERKVCVVVKCLLEKPVVKSYVFFPAGPSTRRRCGIA